MVLLIVLAVSPWFGDYLGRVYLNRPVFGDAVLNPVERFCYRLLGTSPRRSMRPGEYAFALLALNAAVIVWLFLLLTFQGELPGNPVGVQGMEWTLAFHTSASFDTNTDFTHFLPESQLSQTAAILGLQVALFVSAASGLAVVVAMIRGFVRKDGTLGNFYVDIVRTMTRVLLPLSLFGAIVLVLLGLPQTLPGPVLHFLVPGPYTAPLGPVASWTSIELFGSNGGGFYQYNAGTPLTNPTAISNLVETAMMMLIPFGFAFAFGSLVRRRAEAWPYLGAVLVVFLLGLGIFLYAQASVGYPLVGAVPPSPSFPTGEASLFQVVSVYGNVGANNMNIGALTPIAQMDLLFGMFTQSTPGGDGTGFGMLLIYALIAVFVGGLMVGRTPEYLGKRIGTGPIKWAAAVLLSHPALILVPTAVAVLGGFVSAAQGPGVPITDPAHQAYTFTAVLYEFTSESANNGSAMGNIGDTSPFFNLTGALVMLIGRYFPMVGMIYIGGLLARQDVLPPGPGTMRTSSVTFTVFLTGIVIILAGLLFLPVIALGPLSQLT